MIHDPPIRGRAEPGAAQPDLPLSVPSTECPLSKSGQGKTSPRSSSAAVAQTYNQSQAAAGNDRPCAAPLPESDSPPCDPARPSPSEAWQGGTPVAAMEAVMVERMRQILDHGHTPDRDIGLRPSVLPDRAIRYLVHAQEDLHFRGDDHRRRARRNLARAGALVLAAIDYLDNGGGL